MKLATLKNNTRDGALIVVNNALTFYADASHIAATLQAALDDWANISPKLQSLAEDVEAGTGALKAFDQKACESPLPRAYQWADGSAYINHVELVRKARNSEVPESFYHDPLMYQGGSDAFLAPYAPIPLGDPAWGCDMEGEIAVITDDVPMGVSAADAANHIKLIMLCNDVSLRGLIPAELAKGFGFFQSKPPSAFSPIALTPDTLGEYWKDSLVHRQLEVDYNGKPFGRAWAQKEATFSLADLVAHAAKTRPLTAGTVIGSGTVSNKDENGGPGRKIEDGGLGYSCIAEIRMIETIANGAPSTAFMKHGDNVKIDMRDEAGNSIFGAIEQNIVSSR
ncbi:fumarylacetoacetate hydrolase family protein [Hirschia litorea]|uniref:Fumarylacetoacetate hydrolase family protein n=1 Tax=Hirschia litorea TaxID=1199156 RepID=A0ABW2IGY9_9PROT